MQSLNRYIFLAFLITSTSAYSVPVDWKGSLAFDTQIIKDFRRTGNNCDGTQDGECIAAEENNARFQSLTLKLKPQFIINDDVSMFAELSTGNTRTQNLGEATEVEDSGGSYFAQTTSSTVNLNQLYTELYTDSALYRVGRFAKNYGLGAVLNSGNKPTDRFFSGYEGIEMQLKLNNFHLTPMWAKLHTPDSTTGNPNGRYDAYESNIIAKYDSPSKNLVVGVLYGQREVQSSNTLYTGNRSQNVTIIDVFFSKEWEKFSFGLEIPMISGEAGNAYNTGSADIDTNAYILESKYTVNNKWKVGLNAGMVKGDDGESDSFEGMYLHPNYQIAEVMFRYNYHGFTDANSYNIYNSSIVNTTYAQLFAHYKKGEWGWKLSALMAKANTVAEEGKDFYNHQKKKVVTASDDQSDDMGYEFDVAFEYQWNPAVVFSGFLGYHVVGDYYAFSNDTEDLDINNVMSSGMRLSVNF